MSGNKKVVKRCLNDPSFEAKFIAKRPLRGPQEEMVIKIEHHVFGKLPTLVFEKGLEVLNET